MATWPTIIDDDGTGTTGTPIDYALHQQIKAYIDATVSETVAPMIGAWTDVPFAAGNFGASGGTWTVASGNQGRFSYLKIGRTVFVQIMLNDTTVGGTPSALNVLVPWVVVAQQAGWAYYFGPSIFGHALHQQPTADQFLRFQRDGYGTAFVAEPLSFRAMLTLQVAA